MGEGLKRCGQSFDSLQGLLTASSISKLAASDWGAPCSSAPCELSSEIKRLVHGASENADTLRVCEETIEGGNSAGSPLSTDASSCSLGTKEENDLLRARLQDATRRAEAAEEACAWQATKIVETLQSAALKVQWCDLAEIVY